MDPRDEVLGRPVILKLPEGQEVSFDRMVSDLRHVRITYLGENHDNAAHHENQLAVIKTLHGQVRSIAIGLEMFERPAQPALDDWVAGKITEQELLQRSGWYEKWSMDYSLYQPILQFAREKGIKILALNAPGELVRATATKGLAGLTPEEKAGLPSIYLDHSEHRHFIEHQFESQGGHHVSNFERFYEAQRVWDETMADSIARFMSGPEATQVMVVIAGNGHVQYGLGTPDDVKRRVGLPYRIVSMQSVGHTTFGPGPGPPTPLNDFGRDLGDYVWITPESVESERQMLGVTIDRKATPEGGGVRIEKVMSGSPASAAGMKEGDIIQAIDGQPVGSFGDLRYALAGKKMGQKVQVTASRGGEKMTIPVTLSPITHGKEATPKRPR